MTMDAAALLVWMLTVYHNNSAADAYWFGFVVDGLLYVVPDMPFDKLCKFCKIDKASEKKGGFYKVRIRARAAELKSLVPLAILLGSESLLTEKVANKGDGLEILLMERFTESRWEKRNSTMFFQAGDMVINGKQVQVKLNGGELTNEKILKKYRLK